MGAVRNSGHGHWMRGAVWNFMHVVPDFLFPSYAGGVKVSPFWTLGRGEGGGRTPPLLQPSIAIIIISIENNAGIIGKYFFVLEVGLNNRQVFITFRGGAWSLFKNLFTVNPNPNLNHLQWLLTSVLSNFFFFFLAFGIMSLTVTWMVLVVCYVTNCWLLLANLQGILYKALAWLVF